MAVKWLVVVVDGTAITGPYWPTILSNYIEKIVRYISRQSQQDPDSIVELCLVEYKAYAPDNFRGWLVQTSGWTRDVTLFFSWLNGLCFNGYILEESCIAESLAEALVMFPKHPNVTLPQQQKLLGEMHCILVASNNPYNYPRPLYIPVIINGIGFYGLLTQWCFGNAEGVAVSFAQSDSSLSIICTNEFQRLRQIFNMANGRTEGVGSSSDNSNAKLNHHNLLVLLSEKFPEAHAAVYNHQQEVICTSPPQAEETTVDSSAVCEDLGLDKLSEEDKRLLWEILNEPTPETNQPQATSSPAESIGEVEPVPAATVSCAEVQSAYPPNPYLPSNITAAPSTFPPPPAASFSSFIPHQDETGGLESINMLMSDFMTLNNAIHLDCQPAQLMRFLGDQQSWRGSGVPHQTWFTAGTEYPKWRQTPLGFGAMLSQLATNFSSNRSDQSYTGLRGPYSTVLMGKPRSAQSISSSCSFRVSSSSTSSGFANAIATGIPMSSSGNNNVGYDLQPRSVPIQSSSVPEGVPPAMDGGLGPVAAPYLDYEYERYVLAWEGTISARYQEQVILVSRARAYKKITAPANLTALWPQKLQMGHVLANFRLTRATSQAEYCENMVIDVTAQHKVYEQLRKRELCVRIDLPSQTLIIQPTSRDLRFIGTLFNGELPAFNNIDASLNLLPEQPCN